MLGFYHEQVPYACVYVNTCLSLIVEYLIFPKIIIHFKVVHNVIFVNIKTGSSQMQCNLCYYVMSVISIPISSQPLCKVHLL
mgnify:FL=1